MSEHAVRGAIRTHILCCLKPEFNFQGLLVLMELAPCSACGVQPEGQHLLLSAACCRSTGTGCPRRLWSPISGGIQGQAGCGSGQPGLVVGNPAHSKGLELDDHCGPFQPRPFYGSMILQIENLLSGTCKLGGTRQRQLWASELWSSFAAQHQYPLPNTRGSCTGAE